MALCNPLYIQYSTTPFDSNPAVVEKDPLVLATLRWIRKSVVGLNLCPWAGGALTGGRLRVVVTPPNTEVSDYAAAALLEAHSLSALRGEAVRNATTLVIARPPLVQDFRDFLDAAEIVDEMIDEEGLRGSVQLATFHPDYCFEGAKDGDAENFTNRSPYPILHLLLEDQVGAAVHQIKDPAKVWQRNVETTRKLGVEGMKALLAECLDINGVDSAELQNGDSPP
ncbi:unnamed protein product [Discosporangium mesarthrocarpum]